MKIDVICYSGYKLAERPLRFRLGSEWVEIKEIDDRWYGTDYSYFRVLGSDGHHYVLKQDSATGQWELTSYRAREPGANRNL